VVLSHALRGLIVLAVSITPRVVSLRSSHTPLRGLVVLAVFVIPGVISSRSSHTPCVGSLFLLGWWLQRWFTGRER